MVDEGWGAADVVVGVDPEARAAAVYLPNGGPVTLRGRDKITLHRLVDLSSGRDFPGICTSIGEGTCVVDPPADVSEALLFLRLW